MKKNKMTNLEFSKQKWFIEICEKLLLKPTTRQASKFRNKKGLVYKFKFNLL